MQVQAAQRPPVAKTSDPHKSMPNVKGGDKPASSNKPPPQAAQKPASSTQASTGKTQSHRTPDPKFKTDTEGNSNLKQQRLEHNHGPRSSTAKPLPASPGSEPEELVSAADGSAELAPEVQGKPKKWGAEAAAPHPQQSQPAPEESFWHIVSDTLQHPFSRLVESFTQIGTKVFDGRWATPEEIASARKIANVFDMALKAGVPGVAIVGSVGAAINVGEKAANGEQITPGDLAEPIMATSKPSSSETASGAQPSAPAKAGSTIVNFKPPTRLDSKRIGYPLSPTRAPQLPDVDGARNGSATANPVARADAGASSSAQSPPSSERGVFRPEFPLETVRSPLTGKILYKEFARDELYKERPPVGRQHQFEEQVVTDGYNSNYRGKGFEAIVLHGTPKREGAQERLIYQRGRNVRVAFQKDVPRAPPGTPVQVPIRQYQMFAYTRDLSGQELVNHLREDQGLDLVAPAYGGTGSNEPLYLLACNSCRGGSDSTAQQLADSTGREVRAHSRHAIKVVDPKYLSDPASVPHAATLPDRMLAWAQNRMRPNRQDMTQLVHKKFYPRPEAAAAAQAAREAAVGRRLTFQQFPKPEPSTFTPTQPSSQSSHPAGFTPSITSGSYAQSTGQGSEPQAGGAGPTGDAFFDFVPPPQRPTFYEPPPSESSNSIDDSFTSSETGQVTAV